MKSHKVIKIEALLSLSIFIAFLFFLSSCTSKVAAPKRLVLKDTSKPSWIVHSKVSGHKFKRLSKKHPIKKFRLEVRFPKKIPNAIKTRHYLRFTSEFGKIGVGSNSKFNLSFYLNNKRIVLQKEKRVVSSKYNKVDVVYSQKHQNLISFCVNKGSICKLNFIVKLELLPKSTYKSLNGKINARYEIHGPRYKTIFYKPVGRKKKPKKMFVKLKIRKF